MDSSEKRDLPGPAGQKTDRRTLIRNILIGTPVVVLASARSAYANGGTSGYTSGTPTNDA